MTDEGQGESQDREVTTLNGILSSGRRKGRNQDVSRLNISNDATDNWSKLLLIFLMMSTVLIALSVSSYKYLNLGLFCRPSTQLNKPAAGNIKNTNISIPTADYVNCPFDSEQQKDAGALVQSIVSGIIGIVAGMGIGSRKQ